MDAKLKKWVCKVLPWFVGVLLTGLVSGTVLVTDGSIPVDLQGTQWMWLAAIMTVALPLWLAGYVANPQRIVRIVSESVEWMLMGFGALGSPARPGTDCRYISIKPFAFCSYGNIL